MHTHHGCFVPLGVNCLEPLGRILFCGTFEYCPTCPSAHTVRPDGLIGAFISSGTHAVLLSFFACTDGVRVRIQQHSRVPLLSFNAV